MIRPILSRTPLDLSVEDYSQVYPERLKIYPNPASSWIQMELNGEINGYIDVKIYDLSGRIVLNDYIEPQEKINISELKEGIYLIRISDNHGEKVYSEKIIIQR